MGRHQPPPTPPFLSPVPYRGSAECPRCQGSYYHAEGKYFRCAHCGTLVDVLGRPVPEQKKN